MASPQFQGRSADSSYLTAEARARVEIDQQLVACGWLVQDRKEMNLYAGQGVAVREFIMASGHGRADYLLFVDQKAVGAIEAKPSGTTLAGVRHQSAMYAAGLPGNLHTPVRPNVFRARLAKGIEPRLVSYWGNTFGKEWFEGRGKQTTNLASLSLRTLRSFPVPLAPIQEQTRVLCELDRQLYFVEACERAVDVGLARSAGLRRAILKAAFEGKLVPQDPSDEPASVLLDRIRQERAAAGSAQRKRRAKA